MVELIIGSWIDIGWIDRRYELTYKARDENQNINY